jgi:beta-glucosidase
MKTIPFLSQKEFSDTAVVVLGRGGGEGYDLTQYTEGDALALTDEEKDLLTQATDSFGTVVVVLNCANAMEMDELLSYDIDAIVWSGVPGPYGFTSLGSILNGSVNPSGSLVDTWVYDNDSNPVMETFGENQATNADSYYIDYVEGIYVGYKWYETAFAESAVITTTKSGKTFDYSDYDSIVAFPFGYGLSYTTFEQKLVSAPTTIDPAGTVSFDVEVTNTGDVTGKDAVQIYVTANVEDFASYDVSHKNDDGTTGSYMLDAGDYTFTLGDNAHVSYETTTVSLSTDYFYLGDAKRSSDETAASNQFEDVARGQYLSRQDAFSNYADDMASVSTEVEDTTWETSGSYDEALDDVVDHEYEEGVDYAVSGNLTVDDVKGIDYDESQWDELIKQMSVDELFQLGTDATYQSIAIDSIGKGATTDSDGPLGISSMFNSDLNSIAYPCIPLLASTFNVDLAQKYGEIVSDQAHYKGLTGWYAPAMDIHRSPYSGRNFEYFSEDGTLSALMAQAEVSGARSKGMMVYIKHFALNDQETQRSGGLHTYAYEQAIRKIFLKPFEASVKNGGANCIMTSMNFVGDTYAGASVSLITNVLRGEWGFKGKSLTDMDERNEGSIGFDACLRAGTDAWLSIYGIEMPSDITSSETYVPNIVNWQMYVIILSIELALIAIILIAGIFIGGKKKETIEVTTE